MNIPTSNPGVASGVDRDNFRSHEHLLSDSPEPVTRNFRMVKAAAGGAVEHGLYSVMALNAAGEIHQAADSVDRANGRCARVILAGPFTQQANAGGQTIMVAAYVQGHFNADALIWNAAFDTDAKKLAAFDSFGVDDFPNPGQIKLGLNKYNRRLA